ncbi:MAG: 2-alkenal reductase [Acidobacteria bacterium]|mgnify:FL=1|jgi:S1-C subfamily serine protease|nr:2-alkenal reductase [Acidobacteriota bacterium]MDP7340469.1 trypsin-like peptidase domain-containing protein [Vicinamibacterales bacterium]MDP7480374.1 trypsin-like peptidase domain-containing protein [Vicinamibacterales bacterium]MDP7692283.1 trypsin-like peptidase domain-containing protein [Vicinamibacterales bacterium]HJN43157.1 trypsin-like peptidase domain-containing protein [Vicinamibacterales bacterium]
MIETFASTSVPLRRYAAVLGVLALAGVAAACTFELTPSTPASADEPVSTRPIDATRPVAVPLPAQEPEHDTDLRPDEQARVDLLENAIPSVVSIDTVTRRSDFFGRVVNVPQGSGTGFLWDEQGHVVTNFHVVQGATAIRVVMHDQRSYIADYVGGSPEHDLAVLRIDAPSDTLQRVTLGDSDRLRVGQSVYAIGNPFGLSATATGGIVSALNRQILGLGENIIEDVIQIDAAINPGNSGGPLLDSRGRLIGINSQIATSGASTGSIGVGFAVPVNTVQRVVPQLVADGEYTPARLGIRLVDARTNRVVTQRYGVAGLLILWVDPSYGAGRAGLQGTEPGAKLGDIIVKIDGEAVPTFGDLWLILDRRQPGDEVNVTIFRDGETRDVAVTLM